MLAIDHTPDENLCSELVVRMKSRIPKLRIRFKDKSIRRFWHTKRWMESVSVSRYSVWLPSFGVYNNQPMAFRMLMYAYTICLDRNDRPFVWWLFFWFPHYFALASLAAVMSVFISKWFLLSLISLFALLPWRSNSRALLLSRGYAGVMAVNIWRHGALLPDTKDWIAKKMTGAGTYWMLKDRRDVDVLLDEYERLIAKVDAIRGESILSHSESYMDAYEILTGIEREDIDVFRRQG